MKQEKQASFIQRKDAASFSVLFMVLSNLRTKENFPEFYSLERKVCFRFLNRLTFHWLWLRKLLHELNRIVSRLLCRKTKAKKPLFHMPCWFSFGATAAAAIIFRYQPQHSLPFITVWHIKTKITSLHNFPCLLRGLHSGRLSRQIVYVDSLCAPRLWDLFRHKFLRGGFMLHRNILSLISATLKFVYQPGSSSCHSISVRVE